MSLIYLHIQCVHTLSHINITRYDIFFFVFIFFIIMFIFLVKFIEFILLHSIKYASKDVLIFFIIDPFH